MVTSNIDIDGLFKRAFADLKDRNYDWPCVSCVSLILKLSDGLDPAPNYDDWLPKTEQECLAVIKRRAGAFSRINSAYVQAHADALGPGWRALDDTLFEGPRVGDIVFTDTASGRFVLRGSRIRPEIVEWESLKGFPATLFPDNKGNMWCFAPFEGIKRVTKFGKVLKIFRRADA